MEAERYKVFQKTWEGKNIIMYTISLEIKSFNDRNNCIIALVNAGYKVWLETVTHLGNSTYYVCYEAPEEDVREI
jgi:hypothetical protein